MQLAEGGDFTRSAAGGYLIINKLLTVDVGLSEHLGFRAAAPELKFLFDNNSFAIFFKVLLREKFFSFDRAGDRARFVLEPCPRMQTIFPAAIAGEEMRDCAELLSEVRKNLLGDAARKDGGAFLDVSRASF